MRRGLLAVLLGLALLVPGPARAASTPAHTVTYDGYSYLVDGHRIYLWSGEFHYFRLSRHRSGLGSRK